ncbi:MAG: undecaprenyldiphospho-muramoylpentapeptide beta-N-acetylglucosaminyltransferase [Gemmatimonadales bacterium]
MKSETIPEKTILIAGGGTGGHLIPALVIGNAIRRKWPTWRVVLAGAQRGLEAALLPTKDFPYNLLSAEPIYRRQWWKNLKWPFQAIRVLGQADQVLARERPRLVIGTGGYASGPLVWLAARRGIPTAVLELNIHPGLTVRRLARIVREVWIGSPEIGPRFRPGRRTEVVETGTPINPPDPGLRARAQDDFALDPATPTLLVLGGSQGALAINEAVSQWIASGGTAAIQVIWVTGRASYPRFRHLHRPPAVQVADFLDPIAPAYAVADLALTRVGMMTVAELCAWGIPAILVPLPTAAHDHQTTNARALERAGAAVWLPQKQLTAAHLADLLTQLLQSPDRLAAMRRAALNRARPNAAKTILERIGILSG